VFNMLWCSAIVCEAAWLAPLKLHSKYIQFQLQWLNNKGR
jgi:hypothetical protein